MITEIPTPAEFREAGLNQLYLAWQISIQAVLDYEQIEEAYGDYIDEGEKEQAAAQYWTKSQPALANAFGLIQQAMEMALKGRIAAISPLLLIARDPKDWPKGADSRPVPFSEFRTLDAADLVKVHNSFAAPPLDDNFRSFWDDVRRDRNRIMHSVSVKTFDPSLLVRTMMETIKSLFDDESWPNRLKAMEFDGRYAAYGLRDDSQNVVMNQIDVALRHLDPAEKRRYFGFDPNRRTYLCPKCYDHADTKWQDEWPRLAQLMDRKKDCSAIRCVICEDVFQVERRSCNHAGCQGNVLHNGLCLTCVGWQYDMRGYASGLEIPEDEGGTPYIIDYIRGNSSQSSTLSFKNNKDVREHARRSMLDDRFEDFEAVAIRLEGRMSPSLSYRRGRLIGTWYRTGDGLRWDSKTEPPPFGIDLTREAATI
ncbi:hypothetical protein [Sphingopyxis sp. C-1]|uniref:hypothetical protein n=1 Tax=Sphingopyxis sp. C-1 TaxID=262667 RepID=UPI0007846311|nr:hypothetical protein [Sphingopyxis sp. C-1]